MWVVEFIEHDLSVGTYTYLSESWNFLFLVPICTDWSAFTKHIDSTMKQRTDYGRPLKKLSSLHGRKSTPNTKFLGTAEGYFVYHIGPNFQISLIHAFIGCP
jgi:hypothetical protein